MNITVVDLISIYLSSNHSHYVSAFRRKSKLRIEVRTYFLIINLSFSLLLFNIILLLSEVQLVYCSNACQLVGILAHFSLLSSLAWMMVEAISTKVSINKVPNGLYI